jgi:hypothetical protein
MINLKYRRAPDERCIEPHAMALEIRGNQIIRAPAPANIDSGGRGTDQITIAVERVQEPRRIGVGIRLNSPQCIFIYEK